MKPKLTFTPGAIPFILKAFDCHVGDNGFVYDKDGEHVMSRNGEEITVSNFGGIVKDADGNAVFLTKNLDDIIWLVENKKDAT